VAALQAPHVERLRRADGARPELPHAGRGTDVAGDARARDGEDLRDIGFLRVRNATINGKTVEVGRIGMSGNLAYELRGPLEDGPEIYDAVVRAGQDLGIRRTS
jgi:hypothetical protein